MNNLVREDSLKAIKKTMEILKQKDIDVLELKKLSDAAVHNASVFQDDCSISIAVLIYALSKIIERDGTSLLCTKAIQQLAKLQVALEEDDDGSFKEAMDTLFSEIHECDSKLQLYVQEVINKAQIKKGCKLCEFGLSTAQASSVMGVSQWDLMSYLGKTQIQDQVSSIKDVRGRLQFARRLFE